MLDNLGFSLFRLARRRPEPVPQAPGRRRGSDDEVAVVLPDRRRNGASRGGRPGQGKRRQNWRFCATPAATDPN